MTSRRVSPAPPPTYRYPLMTPGDERDNFLDYSIYDGDAGQSREQMVYPPYQNQPREKSPAPQIVRVAKQPEMIRRQSLRPFSGDWGTYEAITPADDSKIPGSFQDAEVEDIKREMIEARTRGAYSHPADIADLYSDVSEGERDFGQEQPLVFPQLPLEDVVYEVAYMLRAKSKPPAEGFTYVFADPTGRNRFYKIGSAKNVSKRANEHRSICNLSFFRVQRKPAIPLRQYKRLEKLAQAELINMSYDPNCVCDIQPHQYFYGREQTAIEILEFWSKWLMKHCPYDSNGHLLPFWEHRLRVFQTNIPKLFDCGGAKCLKRTSDTMACPICLRTGWKAWAEPSGTDKIEFASRTQIGSEWAHKVLLYLHKHMPIPEHVWVTCIDGLAQSMSMCARFKSPVILLNLLYARILIPMLWSVLFTATDTIPFIAMMEIVIFSVIYQLVRLELAQVTAHASIAERHGKESRLVRRKALPSTSENLGDARELRMSEIPDDRVQALTNQPIAPGKGGGKKSESISVLHPSDGIARIKRAKPGRRRSDFV